MPEGGAGRPEGEGRADPKGGGNPCKALLLSFPTLFIGNPAFWLFPTLPPVDSR